MLDSAFKNKSIIFNLTAIMLIMVSILLCADNLYAHERWILTVDEVTEWGSKPRPEIFSTLWSC